VVIEFNMILSENARTVSQTVFVHCVS